MPSTLRVRPQIRQAHSSRPGTRWAAAGHQSRPSNGGVRSGPGIGSNRPNRQRVLRLIKPHPSPAGKLVLADRAPPRLFDHSRLNALRSRLGNFVLQRIAQAGNLLAEILFGAMNRRFTRRPRENQPSLPRNYRFNPRQLAQQSAIRPEILAPEDQMARQRSSPSPFPAWLAVSHSLRASRTSQCQAALALHRLVQLLRPLLLYPPSLLNSPFRDNARNPADFR
jgi:hypothetical protein